MPKRAEERLLNLTTLLLGRREPMSFEDIQAQFPEDYRGSRDAVDKKWTRDKQALVDAGVPIRFMEPTPENPGGYLINPREYYLPRLALDARETAVLWAAGRAASKLGAHPWRDDLVSALQKLACVESDSAARRVDPMLHFGEIAGATNARYVEDLGDAIRRRKRVSIRYFTAGRQQETDRDVDVYGFAWRRGIWLFAGFCHLRQALRVFYLARVRSLKVNPRNPASPDYSISRDFDIRRFAAQEPWDYRVHEAVEVIVRFTGDLAPIADQLLPNARVDRHETHAFARVRTTNSDALIRQVMTLGPDAQVIEPPEVQQRVRAILERIARGEEAAR